MVVLVVVVLGVLLGVVLGVVLRVVLRVALVVVLGEVGGVQRGRRAQAPGLSVVASQLSQPLEGRQG